MKRTVFFIFLFSFVLSGCAFLWDYKPHHIDDKGIRNPHKMVYDDNGVYIRLDFHLIGREPDMQILKDSLSPYLDKVAKYMIDKDWNIIFSHISVNRKDKTIKNIKDECEEYMRNIPDSLIQKQIEWVRRYKKRKFLWFFKYVYDYQIKIYIPLYEYHRGIEDVLVEHVQSEYPPERAFANFYLEVLEGKVKPPKKEEVE